MRRFVLFFGIISLFILFLSSCVKDNFDFDKWNKEINYNGKFAIPLFWGDVSFAEMLNMTNDLGYIEEDENGFLSLVYKSNITSGNVYDILSIEPIIYNQSISNLNFQGIQGPEKSGESVYAEKMYYVTVNTNKQDTEIDSLSFSKGKLNLKVTSQFLRPVKVIVSFPTLLKSNMAVKYDFDLNPGDYTPNVGLNLTGYKLDLTKTPLSFNEIPIKIEVISYGSDIPTGGSIDLELNTTDVEYSWIRGYFGQNILLYENDNIDISIFNSDYVSIEEYMFKNSSLNIFYENSFGIPSHFYFEELIANYSSDNSDHNILGISDVPQENSPYSIIYPKVFNETAKDSFKISDDGIQEVVNNQPRSVKFKALAKTNPNQKSHNNFITKDSKIGADIVVNFPFWGYMYKLYATDTIKIDLSDLFNDKNTLKRVALKTNMRNGFPMEIYGQVYFVNENYEMLDSLFYSPEERLMTAAIVDNNGYVTSFSKKTTTIECDKEMLDNMKNATHVIYKAYANTTNADKEEVIRVYKDYKLNFNIGVEAEFHISESIDSL